MKFKKNKNKIKPNSNGAFNVCDTDFCYNSNFLGSIIRIRHRICAMIWESQSYGVRKIQRMTFLNSIQSGQTLAFVVMLLLTMIATTELPNLVQARQHFILMSKHIRALGMSENPVGTSAQVCVWFQKNSFSPPRFLTFR
jgi:hypothetical protein